MELGVRGAAAGTVGLARRRARQQGLSAQEVAQFESEYGRLQVETTYKFQPDARGYGRDLAADLALAPAGG